MHIYSPGKKELGSREDRTDNKRKEARRKIREKLGRPTRSGPTVKHVAKIIGCLPDSVKRGALLDLASFF